MGTRCLTTFIDEHSNKEIVVMYRQFDGYPDDHGVELSEFLSTITKITDGMGKEIRNTANGINCLAAQVISHFKNKSVGLFYLYPANKRGLHEEFVYQVSKGIDNRPYIKMKCVYDDKVIDGNPEDFLSKCKTWFDEE